MVFDRWNSPKFLFGESYGTPRTCVLTWLLHREGVDLNGIVLQSSILDYSRAGDAVGLLPTLAADALYQHRSRDGQAPPKADELEYLTEEVKKFAQGEYKKAKDMFPNGDLADVVARLNKYLGIPPEVLWYWKLDPAAPDVTRFLTSLLTNTGETVAAYDGRAKAKDTGIAATPPIIVSNDPAMNAIGGVYTTMWNVYLNNELRFTSITPFMAQNSMVPSNWNFGHIDPAGVQRGDPTAAQRGGGNVILYTAGDLAAAMELNPYLKVFSANGYYDAVTLFFQTELNFDDMPCSEERRNEIQTVNYASGHMIYLDDDSRRSMKRDLKTFYENALKEEKHRRGSYTFTRQSTLY